MEADELEDDPDSFRTLESLDQTLTYLSVRMQQSTIIFAEVAAIHGEPRPLLLARIPHCIHACIPHCIPLVSFSYLYASQRSWVQCALLSS